MHVTSSPVYCSGLTNELFTILTDEPVSCKHSTFDPLAVPNPMGELNISNISLSLLNRQFHIAAINGMSPTLKNNTILRSITSHFVWHAAIL